MIEPTSLNSSVIHTWEYCHLCNHNVVICGNCGNNTCNGGYGNIDGIEAYIVLLHIHYI